MTIQPGNLLRIIYVSQKGRISTRVVVVLSVKAKYIRVFCYEKQTYRTLRKENILASEKYHAYRKGNVS